MADLAGQDKMVNVIELDPDKIYWIRLGEHASRDEMVAMCDLFGE